MISIHGFDSCCLLKRMYLVIILTLTLYSMFVLPFATGYSSSSGGGIVVLDDCNFHESVRLDSFDIDRTLTLVSSTEIGGICNFWKLFTYVGLKFHLSCFYRYHQMVNFL